MRYYGSWNPPVIVYQSRPSYGSWDSTFLWWALWNDSSFGYHHRYDPAYQAWRNDALQLAEQNGELKARLAQQDAAVASMEQQKVAQNDQYLPGAVANNPLVALSDDAIQSMPVQKPVLRVATGIEGGRYNQIGQALRTRAGQDFTVELVPTSGSAENWRLLRQGSVDAAIVQSDNDSLGTALNAMNAEAQNDTEAADALNLKAQLLSGQTHKGLEDDPNIAQALGAASGAQPTATLSDRLAALKNRPAVPA